MTPIAVRYHLLLVPPATVFAARVNQTVFNPTVHQVTFDGVTTGAYTDIRPETIAMFGTSAGADDLGRARVRKAAGAATLYVGWSSRSTGEGEVYLIDDAYITVIDLYKPWTKNPRITPAGVNYTDYDRDFTTYGKLPPVILLGCGPATQQPLDAITDEATFTFDASASYVTDYAATVISTWAWTLPAAATLTAGALNTNTVTFTLPVGTYWVSVLATDDVGTAQTRRVLCVAGEPTGTITKFDQVELTRRAEGQTVRVRVSEAVPKATYPNGCMAVLWRSQTANGAAVTPSGLTGHEHVSFVGWHYQHDTNGRATETGFIDDTTLEFLDIGGWLQVLPGYPMVIQRRGVPTIWSEMAGAHIDRYYARLLAEYGNALTLTDFTWSGLGDTYYPFPSLRSEGSTLYEQVDGRAKAIAHRLTCDQWGRLAIKPDPLLIDPVGETNTPITRTATVQKAFTEADWSDIQLNEQPFPRVNWNRESAIVAAALGAKQIAKLQSVFCVAPGNAPSQGTASMQHGEQLVTSQAELNARGGYRYARMNNPLPAIRWTGASPDDFAVQPADMTWATLTNSAATAGQRGRLLTAARVLPTEVGISIDSERGTQTVTYSGEHEVSGLPAQTYIPPKDDSDPEEPALPPEPPTEERDLSGLQQNIFLIHASGEISLTEDFTTPGAAGGPTYTVVDLTLVGTVLDAVTDPYSPLYLGTGTTVNAWIVTSERIYYVTDIAGVSSRVVASQHTFAAASDLRTIQTERNTQNWVMVSSYYAASGVKAAYTTNGSTWSEVLVSGGTLAVGDAPSWAEQTIDLVGTSGPYNPTRVPSDSGYSYWGLPGAVESVDIQGDLYLYVEFSYDYHDADDGGGTYYLINLQGRFNATEWGSDAGLTVLQGNNDANNGANVIIRKRLDYFEAPTVSQFYELRVGWSNPESDSMDLTIHRVWVSGYFYYAVPGDSSVQPTVWVSARQPGTAYAGAVNGAAGDLYRTLNYGANWALAVAPGHDFGESLGGSFHWPWNDNAADMLAYAGKYTAGAYYAKRADGPTVTDITPLPGYGPSHPKCWSTCALNRQHVALLAFNGTYVAGYRSVDGGATWADMLPAVIEATSYTGVHFTDDPTKLYFWGPYGVGFSETSGTYPDDRLGNASASPVVAIGGW